MLVLSPFLIARMVGKNVEIELRGAERIWPPSAARRGVAVPNGEGVASGSATLIAKIC